MKSPKFFDGKRNYCPGRAQKSLDDGIQFDKKIELDDGTVRTAVLVPGTYRYELVPTTSTRRASN